MSEISGIEASNDPFIRIPAYHYVHIINLNTHVTRLLIGHKLYVCQQDEKVVFGPQKMISLSSTEFCCVRNPVKLSAARTPDADAHGQIQLRFGEEEYRFGRRPGCLDLEPFPLYPGESLIGDIRSLPIVSVNNALRLRALVNFTSDDDDDGRVAGEEWIFEGPATYYPRKEVEILGTEKAHQISPNTALCMTATKDCVDRTNTKRVCGEKWLVTTPGMYLPSAYEQVVENRVAHKLTDSTALHMRALELHTDEFGKRRRYGEEWLLTRDFTDSHICGVFEEIVKGVDITVLNARQYCVILNPVDEEGIPQLGAKKLVRGPKSFFLKPGEQLMAGVQNSHVLSKDQGIILRAEEKFIDIVEEVSYNADKIGTLIIRQRNVSRSPGDQWMIRGPIEYVPPIEVTIVNNRQLIPLDRNEGIYVRNLQTGEVRAVIGQAYMLNQDEEFWEKKLSHDVVELLRENKGYSDSFHRSSVPDGSKVVTYQVPHNAAVQIYDYRAHAARVELGPTLVMLGPDEQFTKLSLSGGKPKRPNQIKSLCLLLGPDFFTDVVVVETADHARLSLQLSYNWHFTVPDVSNQSEAVKLFAVPDFIGDACKAMASRIRGTVAGVYFDDFHKQNAQIICSSVFGLDEDNKIRNVCTFAQNLLNITSVDIQSVEPVDQRTRDSLQKSVQLAIEITTNSQEATAKHEAERLEQEASGRLERQKIEDETAAEEARRSLLETRVQLAELKSTGQAKAEAQSRAESSRIEAKALIANAKLRAEAMAIETQAELERLDKARTVELDYTTKKDAIMIEKKSQESQIEIENFVQKINAFGSETISAIATAGSEHSLRMLTALGLQSTLITDGTTPVNLLTTAHGLIGQSAAGYDANGVSSKYIHKTLPENASFVSEHDESVSSVV